MLNRREFLARLGDGFGACALTAIMHAESIRAEKDKQEASIHGMEPFRHEATAKSVIQIFCPGGMSHVDTWDYRPELENAHGKKFDEEQGKQTFAGVAGEYAKSFWSFKQYGQCGRWMSDLFPKLSGHVDDMAFIYSMQNKSACMVQPCLCSTVASFALVFQAWVLG